jgi:hypothetical protein
MKADLTENTKTFKESWERDLAECLTEDILEERQLKARMAKIDKLVNKMLLTKSAPKLFIKEYLEIIESTPLKTVDETFTKKTIKWNLTNTD